MNETHIAKIASELKVQGRQVAATAKLIAEGATVPFIARYRKEATGTLDEVAITAIRDRMLQLAELDERRTSILKSLEELFVKAPGKPGGEQVRLAAQDGSNRLLSFAIEGEIRLESKKNADAEAIRVFAANLRELLLAPALGQKNVLAIDPGFRTGCKVVCLDRQGKLLHHDIIYPTAASPSQVRQAADTVLGFVEKFRIEAIAIGNGTASISTVSINRRSSAALTMWLSPA